MPTTDQGFTTPANTAAPAVAADLLVLAEDVEARVVKVYASAADRTNRNPTPEPGEASVRLDAPNHVEVFDGDDWMDPKTRLWQVSTTSFTGMTPPPPDSTQYLTQRGRALVGTNVGGDGTLVFPQAYGNGVIDADVAIVSNVFIGVILTITGITGSTIAFNLRDANNNPTQVPSTTPFRFEVVGW